MTLTTQFTVFGRVQGVGFRYFTWQKAMQLGLLGTVRNLSDGSVLIIARGTQTQLDTLSQWLKAGGPRSARIDTLQEHPFTGEFPFQTFKIT
ncbi:acylphosphatase [Spirabiliibacterium falconis]|uniref:acylphosphatase n=1 Tax=Spirabiliibacterium falconis TaxID=572023 RepID=UPI001AAC48D3|nr:acylphosphatase [Spirabiliibacterium falconis]MBE2893827.1 acylphosphatase [Spirabiliibacterium falconis]